MAEVRKSASEKAEARANMLGLLAAVGLSLSACGDGSSAKSTEATYQLPADQMGCLRIQLETQSEIEKCMRDVTARDVAEMDAKIAAKTEQRAENAETMSTQKSEGEQLDTTIEGLKKVVGIQERASKSHIEVRTRTMAECRPLADMAEKRACMIEVRDAQRALNTELDEKIEEQEERISELQDENEELETAIKGLERVIDIQEEASEPNNEARVKRMAECRTLADRVEKRACMIEERDSLRLEREEADQRIDQIEEDNSRLDDSIEEKRNSARALEKVIKLQEDSPTE